MGSGRSNVQDRGGTGAAHTRGTRSAVTADGTPGPVELAAQLRALGVKEGGVLLVHTSFRAVRPVEGGPRGLIDALRTAVAPGGTLVMPSWSGDDDAPFDPATTPVSADLGVVADTFWRLDGVARSDHLNAFAAAGPGPHGSSATPCPSLPTRRTARWAGSTRPTARCSCSASATMLILPCTSRR